MHVYVPGVLVLHVLEVSGIIAHLFYPVSVVFLSVSRQ